jgi:plastocyanin
MSSLSVRRPARSLAIAATLCAMALAATPASSAAPETTLVIKDHRFEPAEVKVPANTRVRLVVHNQDASAEEFESHALKVEKVIAGGAKASIFVGPLKPGRYEFVGEFHEATAKGVLVAE